MITSPTDYNELLHQINSNNKQKQVPIPQPEDEPLYEIDLNTRTIKAPSFLSVQYDHKSETIYFICDRYFDITDLGADDITVLIQYKNADPEEQKNGYIYVPTYKDIKTFYNKDNEKKSKIAFPWVIEGPATAFAGDVTFSVKFYKTVRAADTGAVKYLFSLNTQPVKSKVLHGMDIFGNNNENYQYDVSTVEDIYQRLTDLEAGFDLYWEVL